MDNVLVWKKYLNKIYPRLILKLRCIHLAHFENEKIRCQFTLKIEKIHFSSWKLNIVDHLGEGIPPPPQVKKKFIEMFSESYI